MRIPLLSFLLLTWFCGSSQSLVQPGASDTSYYESGNIKTITVYKSPQSPLLFAGDRRLIKTVQQYDECKQLRNTTQVYEVYTSPDAYGIMSPSPYKEEDHFTANVFCDKVWVKPVFLLGMGLPKG